MKKTSIVDFKFFEQYLDTLSLDDLRSFQGIIVNKINRRSHEDKIKSDTYRLYNGIRDSEKAALSISKEDWSGLFQDKNNLVKNNYVYAHLNPLHAKRKHQFSFNGIPFSLYTPMYIGKGSGQRVSNFKRSKMHSQCLFGLTEHGFKKEDVALILLNGLTDREASELESKLILFFGCRSSSTSKYALSGMKPTLYNNQYEPFPDKYREIAGCHTDSVEETPI
jgi:hypothetical protein